MARRAITKEFYDALVQGFAAHPGNAAAAARAAGCDPRTAKRAWVIGWPQYEWARPIKTVIAEQQAAARALAEQREREREQAEREGHRQAAANVATKAMMDAAREREVDGQVARAAKQNALAAQATAMNLLKRGHKISEELTVDELRKLSTRDRVRALKVIAEFAQTATLTSEAAIKLERTIMGEPDAIVQHQHVHVDVAPEEMGDTIERAQAALERAKRAGLVIDVDATPTAASQ